MSTHYESLQHATTYAEGFGVSPPSELGAKDIWPRKPGHFIRHGPGTDLGAGLEAASDADRLDASVPERCLCTGQFGLVPAWVKSASDAKLRSTKLVNARHETVSTSNNFRDAWLNSQRCIVPMMAFFEDDYRPGKAVPTRISRIDGKPMGVAGVWCRWVGAGGEEILSFTLLTVNANSHALMHRYQNPGAEKRMPVILSEGAYDAYLSARPEKAKEFMRPFAAERLRANPWQ
jgi:putative SOS response-associated peptidase YedK